MITIRDIFKEYGDEFKRKSKLNFSQLKAFEHILECRTDACGIHVDVCEDCGHEKVSFNSCKDRHCPQCQTFKKEEWINDRKAELLGSRYFHLVFTIPDDLNVIVMQNRERLYNILFRASSETIMKLTENKIGVTPGFMSVLHTWGQNLDFHPHIHCIVTGGGITKINKWHYSGKEFFIHVKLLSEVFRGKFMCYLKKEYEDKNLNFQGSIEKYNNSGDFKNLINILYTKSWYTYAKKPFNGPEAVIDYLGRYTHRVAISNNRILKIEDGKVSFKWKDYRDSNKVKEMNLDALEFIRRFMLHILPSGFMKIRYYGIIANRNKKTKLVLGQRLTRKSGEGTYTKLSKLDLLLKVTNGRSFLCPCCGEQSLVRSGSYRLNSNSA